MQILASFVINCKNARDRLKAFTGRARTAGLSVERFEAVQEPAPSYFYKNKPDRDGQWGCLQSHLRVLTLAQIRNYPCVVVFEDDAVIPVDFRSRVNKLLAVVPSDFYGIAVGGRINPVNCDKIGPNGLGILRGCLGTHGYLLSRNGIVALRDFWLRVADPVDVTWFQFMRETRKFYYTLPTIVGLSGSKSTILGWKWPNHP